MSAWRQRGPIAIAIAATALSSALPIALAGEADGVARLAALTAGATLALAAWLASSRPAALDRSARLEAARARLAERIATLREGAQHDRRAAELAQRNREEFLAAVSHELRTPLNSIQGFAQVLLSELEGPLSASQREDVDAIGAAGAYLKDLVDEVLEASSSRAPAEAQIDPVDVGAIVREVARLLAGQRRERAIEISVEIPPDLPRVLGDGRRVRQILLNLGSNAMKFTREGTVRLRAVAGEGGGVRVAVEDTGPGIAGAELERIFRAFERVDTTRGRVEGWGLGLAIAREMAQWHGGRIEVQSELGRGSTFTLVLPASGAGPKGRDGAARSSAAGSEVAR